jgi:ADP-ribose pyrophosphatase YjhB (NUDIX family)
MTPSGVTPNGVIVAAFVGRVNVTCLAAACHYAAFVSAVGRSDPDPIGLLAAIWLRVYRFLAWLTQPKYTLGSMIAVCRDDELLLVRQRLRTPSRWGLPGGFQKVGESAPDAARRELREEVGLDIPVRAADLVAQYQQPWAHHIDTLFAVEYDDGAGAARRASLEIVEVRWFGTDDLPPLTREAALALSHVPGRAGLPG